MLFELAGFDAPKVISTVIAIAGIVPQHVVYES